MEIDAQKLRELLNKREKIDEEIYGVVTGREKKPPRCSKCQQEGHTARTCKKDRQELNPSF